MKINKTDPSSSRWLGSACFLAFFIVAASAVGLASSRGDRRWHRWELAAALSGSFSLLDTTYSHDYSPPVYNYTVTDLDSLVDQHVNIKGKNALGMECKANTFIGEKVAIQFLADFHDSHLWGTDNFAHCKLRFSYKPYPDYHPTIINKNEWFAMKDTEGHLRQKTFSLNMLARFPLAWRITLDISGGVSLFLYSGKAEPIGYIYHSFEHFIFVSIPYSFDFSIPTTTTLGANIGEELNVSIGRNVFFYAALRYYQGFTGSSEIKLISDLNSAAEDREWVEAVQERLNLGSLKSKPSFISMKIGLGLGF
jgi:hypothetical protein